MAYYNQGISGGNGAQPFDDSANFPDHDSEGGRLSMVRGRSANAIESIQFVYLAASGYEMPAPHHGGQGGNEGEFDIGDGEHLIALEGSFGNYVDFIRLITDKGRKKEFGTYHALVPWGTAYAVSSEEPLPGVGNYFGYHAPPGYEIFAIWGNSAHLLDAIGVVYRPISKNVGMEKIRHSPSP